MGFLSKIQIYFEFKKPTDTLVKGRGGRGFVDTHFNNIQIIDFTFNFNA